MTPVTDPCISSVDTATVVSVNNVLSASVVGASVADVSVAENAMHLVMLAAVHMPFVAVNSHAPV